MGSTEIKPSQSMEVRWFLRGPVSPEVNRWFGRGYVASKDVPLIFERERVDTYLRLPNSRDLSVKLRDIEQQKPSFEIKQRKLDLGFQALRADVTGQIEQWEKLSYPLANAPDTSRPAGSWIRVKKTRQQRKFAVAANGEVQAIGDGRPEDGCNLELATLDVDGTFWWTLCFEAFSEQGDVEKNLRLVLAKVLEDPEFPAIKAEDSHSYSKWLGLVAP